MDQSSSSATPPTAGSPLPPPALKKSFLRRAVPFLLTANVVVGAYVYLTNAAKDKASEADDAANEIVAVRGAEIVPTADQQTKSSPLILHPSVSEEEQRELFKWILKEKRKVKTKDFVQKQQIDVEKALLKHYIRLGSLPTI